MSPYRLYNAETEGVRNPASFGPIILYRLMGGWGSFCRFPPIICGPQPTEPPAEPYASFVLSFLFSIFLPRIVGPQAYGTTCGTGSVGFRRCAFAPHFRHNYPHDADDGDRRSAKLDKRGNP